MRRRADREVNVFSLSAVDLFAAAMGAFALLAIILLPYYQKEIRELTPENAISDLLRAAQDSSVETVEQRKALEAKRSASTQAVSDIRSEADKLLAELRAAEAALKEKQAEVSRAVPEPEPIEEDPAPQDAPEPTLVPFRFLGMNTSADDIVIALDMNRCMGGHERSIGRAVERIVDSLQDNHALRIVGFQQTDAGPRTQSWPPGGGLRNINASGTQGQAKRFAQRLTGQSGGSASMLHAFREILSGPGQAVFLVSDGLPNPRANDGLSPSRLAAELTRLNGGRKEIHTVVVGNYFDYDGTVEFMESLAARNGGQFMALASGQQGVCD
ncbi:vWA domain-containing protein [uncultured Algimonas sp.]|uniref:vWA domain-containing protein n=1 Tax=uncultured Algimonas sp. TaxID=1547920 RepID=UPI00261BE35B|nr:vWA domain-containing protein [uncultured Algimonas sp.]